MDEFNGLRLPHSVEAEQAVLGSMLIDDRWIPDVVARLTPDDFYLRQNRELYQVLFTMFNRFETIDPDDATKFTSLYEAAGVRVIVTPTRPPSVLDYEIYVGSCGPDGRWGTDDDIRPWVEGEN